MRNLLLYLRDGAEPFAFLALILGSAAAVGLVVVLVLATVPPLLVPWTFPPANTVQGKIARIAWAEPQNGRVVDITDKICPLLDDPTNAQIVSKTSPAWYMHLGFNFLTGEREVEVDISGPQGKCYAQLDFLGGFDM